MSGATAILVAGMHRSGTSALAGALHVLGISLGDQLLEPGPDNPRGYWEHRDVVAIHEQLLVALGSRWDDVRALPAQWPASAPARMAADAIEHVIARDFVQKPLWAIKDPRICRFLPLWLQVLKRMRIRPAVLFAVRHPAEVAASLEARNHLGSQIGEMLWLRYVTEAEAASREATRSVVLYDDLLDDAAVTVRHALDEIGASVNAASGGAQHALDGFIDRASRHHVHGSKRRAATKVDQIADAAYEALTAESQEPSAWSRFEHAVGEFHAYWQQEGAGLDALACVAVQSSQRADDCSAESQSLASRLAAQVEWSQESQARQEALQAEKAELTSRLAAQVEWSQESQARQEALQAEKAELTSKLAAQVEWSQESQARQEALQAEKAELTSKLAVQVQSAQRAQRTIDGLRGERATLLTAVADRDAASSTLQLRFAEARHTFERERQKFAAELAAALAHSKDVATELDIVYASRSWKVTQPLRALAQRLKLGRAAPTRPDDEDSR